MGWEEKIELDAFDIEEGTTLKEIIRNIWVTHWAENCDPMTCPICAEAGETGD